MNCILIIWLITTTQLVSYNDKFIWELSYQVLSVLWSGSFIKVFITWFVIKLHVKCVELYHESNLIKYKVPNILRRLESDGKINVYRHTLSESKSSSAGLIPGLVWLALKCNFFWSSLGKFLNVQLHTWETPKLSRKTIPIYTVWSSYRTLLPTTVSGIMGIQMDQQSII